MEKWLDPIVVVTFYAAIVSTVALIWNIVVLIRNKRIKLKINYKFLQTFTKDVLNNFSPISPELGIEITNLSDNDVYIKVISVDFCGKKINCEFGDNIPALTFLDTTKKIKYPYCLKHGELLKDNFDINSLCKEIGKNLKLNDKIRVLVYDTLGRKHFSKKFNYEILVEQVKFANDYNKNNYR